MESRLDRIIELTGSVLGRLQSDEKLSKILPQARLLAEMNDDAAQAAWLDCEIHGMGKVPVFPQPQLTFEQQMGIQTYNELHRGDKESITVLEHFCISEYAEQRERFFAIRSETEQKRLKAMLEAERMVKSVRAEIHRYVGKVWLNAVQEKENLSLLGPDYRIIVNNLDALETSVGQELMAAVDNLRSTNPANWSASAMMCRNVIIKLGNSLWKVKGNTYYSTLNSKELDVSAKNEKNRLYAYIDQHYQRAGEQEQKDTLKKLHDTVWGIYDLGSKGKRGTAIRHEQAKKLVVDTFEFVNQLHGITGLRPLEAT